MAFRKGEGVTASEKELGKLAAGSFLNLWSYPNLYIDKKNNQGRGQGKELCDLLVVCGPHILIFSDKTIEWPPGIDAELAWARWYRRAIEKSADQIRGAARWLAQFPDRIFVDPDCQRRLPITLPPAGEAQVHGIVVARGAGAACRKHFGGGSPSLLVNSASIERAHGGESLGIFNIGDVNPSGFYIHVLDDSSLNVILQELDTIRDFVWYLEDKASFMRSGRYVVAHGEEELLTAHLRGMSKEGFHSIASGVPEELDGLVVFSEGLYDEYRALPEYIAKKEADLPSYVWDNIVEHFTKHLFDGSIIDLMTMQANADIGDTELALREMALQCRMQRRVLANAIKGAFESIGEKDRFFRLMLSSTPFEKTETGFAFLVFKNNERSNPNKDYEDYRKYRTTTLHGYCLNVLRKRPELKRVVGLATELPREFGGDAGNSHDLLYIEAPEDWTEDLLREVEEVREGLDIFKPETLSETRRSDHEYPQPKPWHSASNFMNPIRYDFARPGRATPPSQRASLPVRQSKVGRNEPCPCGSGRKYKKCCLNV